MRYLAFFISLYAASVSAAEHPCEPFLRDVPDGVQVDAVVRLEGLVTELHFHDLTRSGPFAAAILVDRGAAFVFDLRPKPGQPRALYGRDVMRLALQAFGPRAQFIRACWTTQLPLRDNLVTFNALTAAGVEPDRAALGTWTGRMAAHFGYTEPRLLELRGEPGRYSDVRYIFERPAAPAK